jgi:preprotein translocase subunit SecF
MLVGIITGTYSTVFIASAIAILLTPKAVSASRTSPPTVQAARTDVTRKAKARG